MDGQKVNDSGRLVLVLDGDPAPPRERGTAAPIFSAHVYWSPISATAELLYSVLQMTPEMSAKCHTAYFPMFRCKYACVIFSGNV